MDKVAQERGFANKLREKVDLTGKVLERINPEFADMMENLRATDSRIRTYATDVKNLVRSAKSSLNRRDYLSAATSIAAFHERCRYISAELDRFIKSVDLKHYGFLLDQFDDEQKNQLFGYNPDKELNLGEINEVFDGKVAEAGLMDTWFGITDPLADLAHNLTDERAKAMRGIEKRFSISFLKDLKNNTSIMVARTEKFLSFLLAVFKRLAVAIARRNVDQYVQTGKAFISKFSGNGGYHQKFSEYYNKSILPLKAQQERLQQEAEEAKSKQMEEASKKQDVLPEQKMVDTPFGKKPVEPTLPKPEEKKTEIEEENEPFDLKQKAAEFIAVLQKTSNPKKLATEILSFADEIEAFDKTKSLQLVAIAEGIIEDYKTAGVFDFMKKDKKDTIPAPPPSFDEENKIPLI